MHWIQVMEGPLDQNLIAISRVGGSEVGKITFQLQKSQSAESRGLERAHGASIR